MKQKENTIKQSIKQSNKQTNKQTNKQANEQTNKQTNKQIKIKIEIKPVSSSSNKRNALRISSRESLSLILDVIISRKSEKSIVPDPSLSISNK